jgi:DNA repair photolyase
MTMGERSEQALAALWDMPATIERNQFVHKSLSSWSCNLHIGCGHGCLPCYVPDVSTVKLGPILKRFGVHDPAAEWGDYVFPRPWDEAAFFHSLRVAEAAPKEVLNHDGNRAVIFCSTTDAYQVIRTPDQKLRRLLQQHAEMLTRRSLELIRDHSTLNVRILTRSPMARRDFDLFRTLGNRLLFGMSLPTLDARISRSYEPKAPAPQRRLETLIAAKEAGLNVFVALAPVYPECGREDLVRTFQSVRELEPVTIFDEPVNVRLGNVAKITAQAAKDGVKLKSEVFATSENWSSYAISQLKLAEEIATEVGVVERLHLWPDKSLGSKAVVKSQADPAAYAAWLQSWWNRISEWPGQVASPVPA